MFFFLYLISYLLYAAYNHNNKHCSWCSHFTEKLYENVVLVDGMSLAGYEKLIVVKSIHATLSDRFSVAYWIVTIKYTVYPRV